MILTISTNYNPATDLGFLLHKHPDKFQTFDLSFGKAHIFYSECSDSKASINLLLDIDPIDLVRKARKHGLDGFALGNYVNDRPYVASSFMSVAISKLFSSALNGKCKEKPELVNTKIPLQVSITSIPAPRGGDRLIRKLFKPLGYQILTKRIMLDEKFPEWGESKYFSLQLENTITIKDLLSHLYVLIPTLDSDKHYFISEDEINKLLSKGEGWLQEHPERDLIVRRYLINLNSLSNIAIARLNEGNVNEFIEDELKENSADKSKKESLNEKRMQLVLEKLLESGAKRILDLGCGDGKLLKELLKYQKFTEIVGMDVSYNELIKAKDRLHWEDLPHKMKEKIKLYQGSLTYSDNRLLGYDAAAVVEVIEHLDLNRLSSFEKVLFGIAKPNTIILTTPNKEYNVIYENLDGSSMRHDDHRFEWNRKEFTDWAEKVAKKYSYTVNFYPIGDELDTIGAPTQMAIFNYGN
ncbi:MAG: 3' terminal RNA ribose 2'-O-methyltransferase Hen1 [Leptospira sp.]|nr:3' terminal RNA ribose 2'-O-methyltransferase Hen1 [Leptospira sp.]